MTRVLHVISEMGVGGAESVVVELVRGSRGFGWTSAIASSGGVRADELAATGTMNHHVPTVRRSPFGIVRAVSALRQALRTAKPDAVIAHNPSAFVISRLAVRGRVPILAVFHGVADADYQRSARILRRAPLVIAVSEAVAERLRGVGIRRLSPVVVHNAVHPHKLPAEADARTALGLPPQARVVLSLARLVRQKRHDVLLKAWSDFVSRPEGAEDVYLLLTGDGPQKGRLERMVENLGIKDSVQFLGNRDDVPTLLAAADLTVLTSDWEGLPVAVLESLAAGRPVIATDVGGVREILGDGGGELVPAGDVTAVAEALHRMLTDPERRSAAAAEGRETIERKFTPGRMKARYAQLVDNLIDAHRRQKQAARGRITAVLAVLAALLVGASTWAAVGLSPARYQGRIGIVADPSIGSVDPAQQARFGEVVQLVMPAVAEIVRTPSVLASASTVVSPPIDPRTLADSISVEYVAGTGVARISVTAGSAQAANDLSMAVARGVVRSDILAPVAGLRVLDQRADVTQIGPDITLATGLALVAALVAMVAVVALRHLVRAGPLRRSKITDALSLAGATRPVAVIDAADPDLMGRLSILQDAASRPLRVVGTTPGRQDEAIRLAARLHAHGAVMQINGHVDQAAVVALLDRRFTATDDVTAAISVLPDVSRLVAVVLS